MLDQVNARKLSTTTVSGQLRRMKVGEKREFSRDIPEITLRNNCSKLKKAGDGEWTVAKKYAGGRKVRFEVERIR